jgi:UDP-GlcNAc:undecaprenyl-phosphate GlcNAc-1-phosphate transferase
MFDTLTILRFASLAGLVVLSSAILTLVVERTCIRVGWFDMPGERKMQKIPVPRMGGLAVVLTIFLFAKNLPLHVPEILWGGALLVFVGGFLDDAKVTNSVMGKLFFQIPSALFFAMGCHLEVLPWDHAAVFGFRGLIFLFVFFMTNAANLMDNMNGLAGGISVVIIASFAALAGFFLGDLAFATAGGIVCASVIGFSFRNFPAGKIYIGDQGSQFLGFFAACYAILFWIKAAWIFPHLSYGKASLLLAGSFLLFIYDVASVVRIRLKEGRSPFVGDQSHISHRLVKKGFTPTRAVLILIGIQTALSTLIGFLTATLLG